MHHLAYLRHSGKHNSCVMQVKVKYGLGLLSLPYLCEALSSRKPCKVIESLNRIRESLRLEETWSYPGAFWYFFVFFLYVQTHMTVSHHFQRRFLGSAKQRKIPLICNYLHWKTNSRAAMPSFVRSLEKLPLWIYNKMDRQYLWESWVCL